MPPSSRFQNPAVVASVTKELRARHEGGYPRLAERLVEALRTYAGNSGNDFVIGLSGGVDSSLVTALAVHALGCERVHPVTLPAWRGDPCSERAASLRASLGFSIESDLGYEVDIEPIVREHVSALTRLGLASALQPSEDSSLAEKIALGNLASRTRIALLYHLAQATNSRVLGTGSRTEFVQGYTAKFGTPMACDYGVLDQLYKVDIVALAEHLQLPDAVLDSQPTSGYYPEQTHAEELGALLEEQDVLAYLLFERGLPPEEVVSQFGADPEFCAVMAMRYERSRHKRMLQSEHFRLREGPFPR